MYTLCEKVIKASESESECAIFPLSFNHLIETRNRRKTESRERLIEFMAKVSKKYTIMPMHSGKGYRFISKLRKTLNYTTFSAY